MRGDEATELLGFDSSGILCGRAAYDWVTGSWSVWAGRFLTADVWCRAEAERILRQHGAAEVREEGGPK